MNHHICNCHAQAVLRRSASAGSVGEARKHVEAAAEHWAQRLAQAHQWPALHELLQAYSSSEVREPTSGAARPAAHSSSKRVAATGAAGLAHAAPSAGHAAAPAWLDKCIARAVQASGGSADLWAGPAAGLGYMQMFAPRAVWRLSLGSSWSRVRAAVAAAAPVQWRCCGSCWTQLPAGPRPN